MKLLKRILHKILNKIGYLEVSKYHKKKARVMSGIRYHNRDLYSGINGSVLFIHIPKAAGMSLVSAIYGRNSSHHAGALDYWLADKEKFCSFYSFAVSRDPYQRLFSAYNYLRKNGKEEIDQVWNELYIAPYSSFEEFVMFGLEKAVKDDAEHFIPQYKYVTGFGGELLCSQLFKLEDIGTLETVLAGKVADFRMPRLNRSSSSIFNIGEHYTDAMVAVVNELYEIDFRVFDYAMLDVEEKHAC